jgi:uncharacterized protein YfaS (alpha-2-macroglobulin family)
MRRVAPSPFGRIFEIRVMLSIVFACFTWIVTMVWAAEPQDITANLAQAKQLMRDNNFAEASEKFRAVIGQSESTPDQVVQSLNSLSQCQLNLGLQSRLDADLARALESHPNKFQVFDTAANLLGAAQHWGIVADQKFSRGYDQGLERNGTRVDVTEQDRLQALQWRQRALQLARDSQTDVDPAILARIHLNQAQALLVGRGPMQQWRLQSLTDLSQPPNYLDLDSTGETAYRASPVDTAGKPILYTVPASWEEATSDGQRYRWSLAQAEKSNTVRDQARFGWAQFLHQQFSVDTLQQDAWLFRRTQDDASLPDQGIAAMHTLEESETIAKLASGIQRFSLPDEFNPLRIFQELAAGDSSFAQPSKWQLVQTFLNRRQYTQAAEHLTQYLARWKDDSNNTRQSLLDNILLPRLSFDPTPSQVAGNKAELSLLFRNATQVAFTARQVDVEKILRDTKTYYRNLNPQRPSNVFGKRANTSPPNLSSPGSLFDQVKIDDYLLEQVAQWQQALEPRPNHWDRRITIETPLSTAGLYLIEADGTAQGSQASHKVRCLVWIEDLSIVEKPASQGKSWLSLADARTGQAIANANIELFGWGFDYSQTGNRRPLLIENFSALSDREGLAEVEMKQNLQWFCAARTSQGSLALLGFHQLWPQDFGPQAHAELKAYGVSDRPLYRPGETVKAKFWLGYATYGDAEALRAANSPVRVTLLDPQGLEVASQQLVTDDYGGCDFEMELADSAPLGRYNFHVHLTADNRAEPAQPRRMRPGVRPKGLGRPAPDEFIPRPAGQLWANVSLAIRVEEYRKPEFEVKIQAPEKPVALGETVKARIDAHYYFGAPVTDAEVTVKVERSTYRESYYPWAPYDWCYGPGYWWFAEDYTWYPGWTAWRGCLAPTPTWWPGWGFEPPELVLQQDLELDSTGSGTIEIDTALAKAIYGDEDHKYTISVEVRDASRRTITAQGSVIAAREPFKIYGWVDRGHYAVGDRIEAHFQARQLDGTSVTGSGTIDLLRITYDAQQKPQEQVVASFQAKTDDEGQVTQQMSAERAGQYRVRFLMRDEHGHELEGGYIFTVRGDGSAGDDFRYNALELMPDKQHYAPGDTVRLQVAANFAGARVALLVKPSGEGYARPQWLTLDGKSTVVDIPVTESDQPNFFIEAYTVYDGKFHQAVRQILVPPAERVLDVEVAFDKSEYLPGEEARVDVTVTDAAGKPVVGSCVVAAYDRALEALAGDVLPPDIREFFWKWQRHHAPQSTTNLNQFQQPIQVDGQPQLMPLGIFGGTVADDSELLGQESIGQSQGLNMRFNGGRQMMSMSGFGGEGFAPGMGARAMAAPMAATADFDGGAAMEKSASSAAPPGGGDGQPTPTLRKDFADSALWLASLTTDSRGKAQTTFKMPENLTSWQLRTWSMASHTRVGSSSSQAVTRKPLLVRLQTPRFLVERDEVIISAIVHNDLDGPRTVKVSLEIDGETQLELLANSAHEQTVEIAAHQQSRIDWRCRATAAGKATVRAIAVTHDASDAMQLELPVLVNGILKQDSFAGTVRQGQASSEITLRIPAQRRVEQSTLVVRLSPSLAAAMIDALPYLAEYPYGCTEQTLNRFLPSVITQRTLQRMNIDLGKLKEKRNNLNAQELGEPAERRARWRRFDHTAVFDDELVQEMVVSGVARLSAMQNGDGGWGWFSGAQEQSGAHTTATVVRGLLLAQQNNVPIVPDVLQRGLEWLEQYQATELLKLQNADGQTLPFKNHPDNVDALVFHVLALAERTHPAMQQILYNQREHLSVYGKALLAWAVHQLGDAQQTTMLRRNIEQFLVQDAENETAYLRSEAAWWYWYGSDIEANAIYLKLLAAVEPNGLTAPRVVKYLLNNRKHATYWNSTRDTALVVEAFADYIAASGEMKGNLKAEVYLSGKRLGTVEFTPDNLFDVNNSIEIHGAAIPAGEHKLEIRRIGSGNLYWNAYATNFTLEDEIRPAGLEVKIERRYYHLRPTAKQLTLPDQQAGIVATQKSGFERSLVEDLQAIESGELIEVELLIESKNDYEYLLIEDPKAAGAEAVETQSGYFYNAGLSIYRELRDQHVGLCIRWLPKGNYSIRYQLRSETPGSFTALPTVIQGMYAPELRGNSADFDLQVVD